MVEVESDEEDDLEFVHQYDLDDEVDDDANEFIDNIPNDASFSTDFAEREYKFTKMLKISRNGTKTFIKNRQSAKIGGHSTSSATGNCNTSLDVTTSASGKFDLNMTFFWDGQNQTVVGSGTIVTSSSSKSKVKKRRLFQHSLADSSTFLQLPSRVHVNSSVRSGSETLKLPFRTYLTLFKAEANTTTEDEFEIQSTLAGEVISRVAFANKTVSLTKSCIKAYVRGKSVKNIMNVSADDKDDKKGPFHISLIKAKAHTWTTVVSQSKTEVVVDVITCTKTRIYGKSVDSGVFEYYGSGQISWKKSRITIVTQRIHNLSPREYGVHLIKKQLEGGSLIKLLANPFEMTM